MGVERVKNTSLTLKDYYSQSFGLRNQKIGIYGLYCISINISMKLILPFSPLKGYVWGERGKNQTLDHYRD